MDLTRCWRDWIKAREQAIALLRIVSLLIASGDAFHNSPDLPARLPSPAAIGAATCEQQALALLERERPDLLMYAIRWSKGQWLAW